MKITKVVCKNNNKNTYYDEDEYEFQIHLNILSSDKWGKKGENLLIIDKVYDVKTTDIDIKTGIRYYLIENEIGIPYFFSETRFYTIDEYRELKLNKLGI
jgi:hypothetical protein